MTRPSLLSRLAAGEVLVSDGAWGTFLQARGLPAGEAPELWNVEHPEVVSEIAVAYLAAGADMIETNSFGGNRVRLASHGLAERAAELNEAAARISRAAAGEDHYVLGSMGPTGAILALGDVSEDTVAEAFAEQARALDRGGVDVLCLETFSALDEALLAVRAARSVSSLPIACTFTFESGGPEPRTMMGHTPEEVAQALREAGVDILGTNCGRGIAGMIEIVRAMRRVVSDRPILVHANAGLPTLHGGRPVWPDTPEYMARLVPELLAAGASIVGGCCGTTPDHVRAIRRAVDEWRAQR